MSVFPGQIFGGPFYGGYGMDFNSAPLVESGQRVDLNAVVEPQAPLNREYSYPLLSHGQTPGFDNAPPESTWLFWQMRRYSAIQLAFAVVTAPVLAGTQTIEIVDDGSEGDDDQVAKDFAAKWKAKAEKDVLPLLAETMPAQMECLHFGHWLQEIVWEARDGRAKDARIVPIAFRSILPGMYIPYRDIYGQFAGFQTLVDGGEFRDARYALLSVNEPWLNPIFGYSRNASCREEWWRIRQSEANADKTERKASGIQLAIGVPIGASWTDTNGKALFGPDICRTMVDAATANKAILYPLIPFSMASVEKTPELLKASAIDIKQFDWGNIGPALLAHLDRIDKQEIKIMRAWRRPERESMAGQHGTNAESETQGSIGTTDSELVGAARCKEFTDQVLSRYMIANAGPQYAKMLCVKMTPLSDPQQSFLQKVYETLAQNTATGPDLVLDLDRRALAERIELPLRDKDEVDKERQQMQTDTTKQLQDQLDAQKKMAAKVDPVNGNVNGKANGDGKRLALAVDSINRISQYLEPDDDHILALDAGQGSGHWVTIDGQHVLIGKDGVIQSGHNAGKHVSEVFGKSDKIDAKSVHKPGEKVHEAFPKKKRGAPAEKTPSKSAKSLLASKHAKLTGAEEQRYSEEHNEPVLAKGIGGMSLRDNEPIDVMTTKDGVVTHGTELKTMVSNKARKLTMGGSAIEKKKAWMKKNHAPMSTIVFDDHEVYNAHGPGQHDPSQRRIFYRRGFGSFRVDTMHEVKGGMKEVRALNSMADHELPDRAKPPAGYKSPKPRKVMT